MERIGIKITEIEFSEVKYKQFDHVMFEKIKASLKMFGQVRPINCLISCELKMCCFEGRMILKAALELGWEAIEVNKHDFIDPLNYILFRFAINEMNFKNCDVQIAKILQENLNENILPFTKSEIEAYKKLLDFDWVEFERSKNDLKQTNLFDV